VEPYLPPHHHNREEYATPASLCLVIYARLYISISALAIDPITPSTLYAGTWNAGGVFKSTDSGGSWSAVNTGLPTDTFGYTHVVALVIDPTTTPNTLYGADANYVYQSTNSGSSWSAIDTGQPAQIVTLGIDPTTTPSTLYAAPQHNLFNASCSSIFESTDSGGSWSNIGLSNLNVSVLAIPPTRSVPSASSATATRRTSFSGHETPRGRLTDYVRAVSDLETTSTPPSVDVVVLSPKPLSITIPKGTTEVDKTLAVTVRNVGSNAGTMQLAGASVVRWSSACTASPAI
jgi:hypothetical protein